MSRRDIFNTFHIYSNTSTCTFIYAKLMVILLLQGTHTPSGLFTWDYRIYAQEREP